MQSKALGRLKDQIVLYRKKFIFKKHNTHLTVLRYSKLDRNKFVCKVENAFRKIFFVSQHTPSWSNNYLEKLPMYMKSAKHYVMGDS